jgi:uncharacterized protein YbjT (DUF2867 family)
MATALIAGASGLVGGCLLRHLLEAPEYDRVVSVGRCRLDLVHPKLGQVVADFTALDKLPERLRGDDAFCCLGTTMRRAGSREAFRAVDHGAVLALAWAAKRGGARRFFTVSALGADPGSRVFYNRVKGEIEEALRVLGFATLGIFRPSLLLGSRREFRPGERLGAILAALFEPVLFGRLRRYRAIQAEVVARAMLRCSFGTGARGVLVFESDEIQDLGR